MKKPLYLILLLTFALIMPPGFAPQAAFAGAPPAPEGDSARHKDITKTAWDAYRKTYPKLSKKDLETVILAIQRAEASAHDGRKELQKYIKFLGPAAVADQILSVAKANGGKFEAAAYFLLQGASKDRPKGELAKALEGTQKVALAELQEAASGKKGGEITVPEGVEVGDSKNKAAEAVEKPLAVKIDANEDIAKDIGAIVNVFSTFIWTTWEPDNTSFIAKDLREKEKAATSPSWLTGQVNVWVTDALTSDMRRYGTVVMYLGLGDATAPQWAEKDPMLKTLLTGPGRSSTKPFADFKKNMRGCLGQWAKSEGDNKPMKGCFGGVGSAADEPAKQLGGTEHAEWISSFLREAIGHANILMAAANKTPEELAEEINKTPETVKTPGDTGDQAGAPERDRDNRIASDKGWTMNDLFGRYGDKFKGRDGKDKKLVNVFRIDGREFALVARTIPKYVKGKDGVVRQEMTNQVGIYDVSQKYDIVGKRFDLTEVGEHEITLPGRVRSYKITIPRDRTESIKFEPSALGKGEDGKIKVPVLGKGSKYMPGDGSKWLDHQVVDALPSMDDLFRARTQKAMASADEVTIDGKAYLMTAESAGTGNFLYWDKEKLAQAGESKDPWFDQPAMVVRVNKVGKNGTEPVSDAVTGVIPGGQDAKGQWWGLKWEKTAGGSGYYKTVKMPSPPVEDEVPAKPGTKPATNPETPTNPAGGVDEKTLIASGLDAILKLRLPGTEFKIAVTQGGNLGLFKGGSGYGFPSMTDMKQAQFLGKEGAVLSYPTGENHYGLVDIATIEFNGADGKPKGITEAVILGKTGDGFQFGVGKGNSSASTRIAQMFVDGELAKINSSFKVANKPEEFKEKLIQLMKTHPTLGSISGKTGDFNVELIKGGATQMFKFKFANGKWTTGETAPDSNQTTEGNPGDILLSTKGDTVSPAKDASSLPGSPSNPMEMGGKSHPLLAKGVGASGVYFLPKVDDSSPAQLTVRFSIKEAKEGKHLTKDHLTPQFIMKSMDGFTVLGSNLTPALKEKVKTKGSLLTVADLPKKFQVGAIDLPAGFTWSDVVEGKKFRTEPIGGMNADEGGMVLLGQLDGKKFSYVGYIAIWGSVTAESAKTLGNAKG